jgi:hypothetical protein
VTAGNELAELSRLAAPDHDSYDAASIVAYLRSGLPTPAT